MGTRKTNEKLTAQCEDLFETQLEGQVNPAKQQGMIMHGTVWRFRELLPVFQVVFIGQQVFELKWQRLGKDFDLITDTPLCKPRT
jgi:hypothetical protein